MSDYLDPAPHPVYSTALPSDLRKKEPVVGILMGLFLPGLVGFLFSAREGLMILLAFTGITACTLGLALPFLWIAAPIYGFVRTQQHNQQADLLRSQVR